MDVINFQNSEIRKLIRPITARPNFSNDVLENLEEGRGEKACDSLSQEYSSKRENFTIENKSEYEKEENENRQREKDSDIDFAFSEDNLFQYKSEIEKILNEENQRLEYMNKQKEKMKKIDLIEKNVNELYEWKSLFNKSRPITAYTHSSKNFIHTENDQDAEQIDVTANFNHNKKDSGTSKEKKAPYDNNKEIVSRKPFKFPIALINEKEDKIKDHITFDKNNINKRKNRSNKKIANKNKNENLIKKNKDKTIIKERKISSDDYSQSTRSFNTKNSEIKIREDNNKSNINFNLNYNLRKSSSDISLSSHNNYASKPRNATRPQSVYAKRKDDEVYYLNQAFSDYFTQDLSDFIAKFPLLHPKIKCKNNTLQKTLNFVKNKELEDQKMLETKRKEEFLLTEKDLHLAGNSKNIVPLLKSMYTNLYPNSSSEVTSKMFASSVKGWEENKKLTAKENKISKKRNHKCEEYIGKIKIDTYNVNDPEIKILWKEDDEKPDDVRIVKESFENSSNRNTDLNFLLKDIPEVVIENLVIYDEECKQSLNKTNLLESKEKLIKSRPQTTYCRIKSSKNFLPISVKNYRNQSAVGKPREISFTQKYPEEDQIELIEVANKKYHNHHSKSEIDLPNSSSNPIPYPLRTFRMKEKPSNHPFQYKNLKNALEKNKKCKDLVMIEEFKNELLKQGVKLEKAVNTLLFEEQPNIHKERPNTSIGLRERPRTSVGFRRINNNSVNCKQNDFITFKKILAYNINNSVGSNFNNKFRNNNISSNKEKKINYLNFNDYIDIQFRGMNQNSRYYNSYQKNEMPVYFTKLYETHKQAKPETKEKCKINEFLKITNLNVNNRKVKSARVKL